MSIELINTTTYKILPIKGKIEIGDIASPDFRPMMKLSRWDDESGFELLDETIIKVDPIFKNDIVSWKISDREIKFYDKISLYKR